MKTLQEQITDLRDRLSAVETKDFTKGQLRLLFTLEERAAQAVYLEQSRKAAAEGTATPDQATFLAIERDWRDAPVGFYRFDENFLAGLAFYVSIGLLTVERKDEIEAALAA